MKAFASWIWISPGGLGCPTLHPNCWASFIRILEFSVEVFDRQTAGFLMKHGEVFKKALLFEVSGSVKWCFKLAKGVAGSCSVRCSGQMPWKAACLAQVRSSKRLREILLMPAYIHLLRISSFAHQHSDKFVQAAVGNELENWKCTPERKQDSP